jgi:hypothetical protein
VRSAARLGLSTSGAPALPGVVHTRPRHACRPAALRTTAQSVDKLLSFHTVNAVHALLRVAHLSRKPWGLVTRVLWTTVANSAPARSDAARSPSRTSWGRQCHCRGRCEARMANSWNCSLFIFKRVDNIDSRTLTCQEGRRALRGAVGSLYLGSTSTTSSGGPHAATARLHARGAAHHGSKR